MKFISLTACASVALTASAPTLAQHSGHSMPMPMAAPKSTPKPVAKAKPAAKKPPARAAAVPAKPRAPARAKAAAPRPAPAPMSGPMSGHEGHGVAGQDQAAPMTATQAPQPDPQPEPMADHEGMDHGSMDHGSMDHSPVEPGAMDHSAMGHEMLGALGPYPMSREASGTAWQPDSSVHEGVEIMTGGWMLMGHAVLNGVYDWQEGPRGDDKVFASGMLMGIAQRRLDNGDALQFKAMLSPDPLMGKKGYPLLLASGETANGVDPLVDRQHPHDLFMELSASYSVKLGERSSAFVYGGLPGEPAFGPPAFMHRMSIMDLPEAPISHHWLDSTHITFGVLTAGVVLDRFKLEASRFRGREPDQHRYDIETGPLDSTALRLSFNPTRELSIQGSWTHLHSPEQLEPGENQTRWSASAIYTRSLGQDGWWSTTAAWGRRSSGHEDLDALVLESAVGLKDWTLFGRAEYTQNNELVSVGGHHGPAYDVGKFSLGAIRDFRVAEHVKFGLGGLYALNFVPDALEPFYGGDRNGAMAFVRLKID